MIFDSGLLFCLQDNSPTNQLAVSQLADSEFKKKHGITILYLYIKPNPNSNPIEYRQRINSVICLK